VVERAAVAVVVVHFDDVADETFLNQAMGGDVTFHPAKRPVDHQFFAGGLHCGDHPVGFGQGIGEGFLNEEMGVEGSDAFHPQAMVRRRRAQDHEVGPGLLQAGSVVGENLGVGEGEDLLRFRHSFPPRIADADDLGVGVAVDELQVVSHVHVGEFDAGDFPGFGHGIVVR